MSVLDINKTISRADKSIEIYAKTAAAVTGIANDMIIYLNSKFNISWSTYKYTDLNKGDFGTFDSQNLDICDNMVEDFLNNIRQICIKYYPNYDFDDITACKSYKTIIHCNGNIMYYQKNEHIHIIGRSLLISADKKTVHHYTITVNIIYKGVRYEIVSVLLYSSPSCSDVVYINKAIFNK